MTEKTDAAIAQDNAAFDSLIEQKRYQLLKTLLLKDEEQRLSQLETYFDNPDLHAEKIAQVLPQALEKTDATALYHALNDSIQTCTAEFVEKNPELYAEVLYPVIFPAIKKSISEAFKEMMQSLNYAIEQGLSLNRFAWHYEAWRSGVPYREVVLRHTLTYRVEQAFLIHRETGLLLRHVALAGVDEQRDSDAVSAMLTAIQDFIKDSFSVNSDDYLDMVEIGDYTVFLNRGPSAVLACVIQGIAPYSLREKFETILQELHQHYGLLLKNFDGDNEPLAVTEPGLQACLVAERKQPETADVSVKYLLPPLALICALLGYLAYDNWQFERRAQHYLNLLQQNQSIVITEQHYDDGQLVLNGLYDPLSAHPDSVLKQSRLQKNELQSHWLPYQSLAPFYLLQRIKQTLQPPPTVSLKLADNRLLISGIADDAWIKKLQFISPTLLGVAQIDSHSLQNYQQQLRSLSEQVVEQAIYFVEKTALTEAQIDKLAQLAALLKQLQNLAQPLNINTQLIITGHTDGLGNLTLNSNLARKRANLVQEQLKKQAVSMVTSVAVQLGKKSHQEDTSQRKVSFAVVFNREKM